MKDQKMFFYPANAESLSEESLTVKHLKHHAFIGMYSLFTWFHLQILNLCSR